MLESPVDHSIERLKGGFRCGRDIAQSLSGGTGQPLTALISQKTGYIVRTVKQPASDWPGQKDYPEKEKGLAL